MSNSKLEIISFRLLKALFDCFLILILEVDNLEPFWLDSLSVFFLFKILESCLYTRYLKFHEDMSWYGSVFIYCVRHSVGLWHLETYFFGNFFELQFDFFFSIFFSLFLECLLIIWMWYNMYWYSTSLIFKHFLFPSLYLLPYLLGEFFQLYFLTLLEFFIFAVTSLISIKCCFLFCLFF